MKLPKLEKPEKYAGLYIFDFGDQAGVGFTAEEVGELLESERYREGKVYKIHRAYPDGRMEIRGVPAQTFQLESGMLFYAASHEQARADFQNLVNAAVSAEPPCRAKVHLAKYADDKFAVALIYPAEYEDEIGSWLLGRNYRTSGAAEGGTGAVERYYQDAPEVVERHQLFGTSEGISRTGDELLVSLKRAVQR